MTNRHRDGQNRSLAETSSKLFQSPMDMYKREKASWVALLVVCTLPNAFVGFVELSAAWRKARIGSVEAVPVLFYSLLAGFALFVAGRMLYNAMLSRTIGRGQSTN